MISVFRLVYINPQSTQTKQHAHNQFAVLHCPQQFCMYNAGMIFGWYATLFHIGFPLDQLNYRTLILSVYHTAYCIPYCRKHTYWIHKTIDIISMPTYSFYCWSIACGCYEMYSNFNRAGWLLFTSVSQLTMKWIIQSTHMCIHSMISIIFTIFS